MCSQDLLDNAVDSFSNFLVSTAVSAAGPALGAHKPHVPRRSGVRNLKFCKKSPNASKPKWFDVSCEALQRQLRVTSRLLSLQPNNPYLKGKLFTESKEYKRACQLKKRQHVQGMFLELEAMHKSNPKGYMDLVRSLRDGIFDKKSG